MCRFQHIKQQTAHPFFPGLFLIIFQIKYWQTEETHFFLTAYKRLWWQKKSNITVNVQVFPPDTSVIPFGPTHYNRIVQCLKQSRLTRLMGPFPGPTIAFSQRNRDKISKSGTTKSAKLLPGYLIIPVSKQWILSYVTQPSNDDKGSRVPFLMA